MSHLVWPLRHANCYAVDIFSSDEIRCCLFALIFFARPAAPRQRVREQRALGWRLLR